ncbi:MAG: hypothetical protein HND52_07125 [Ignavibacteriae bacterium]|nr:hypothetical protein [Ignavibacteriota bacterium]NOG97716.1 hypothetical protein [Ignavibacteriota bacterium]
MRYFKITIIVLFLLTNCNDASVNTGSNPNQTKANQNDALVFKRINELEENAFSIPVPKEWQYEGGIFRVNPFCNSIRPTKCRKYFVRNKINLRPSHSDPLGKRTEQIIEFNN